MTATNDTRHIPQLDGFRGIAILLVLGYHYFSLRFGWIGVDLFFVLSGFLITGKLLSAPRSQNIIIGFYLRRILRIVPLYFLVCLVFFWIIPLVRPSLVTASWQQLIQMQLWYWSFGINIYNALHGWTSNIGFVHFWSLACEMQFYLLWPLLILAFPGNTKWLAWFLFACIVFAIGFRCCAGTFFSLRPIYRYVLLPSRLDAFATGALLWLFVKSPVLHASPLLKKGCWLSAAVTFIAVGMVATGYANWKLDDAHTGNMGYTTNAFFWAGLMATALSTPGYWSKLTEWRPLRLAGKYSYGIYVFHQPVKFAWLSTMKDASNHAAANWMMAASLISTIVMAVLSYEFFEKRLLTFRPLAQ